MSSLSCLIWRADPVPLIQPPSNERRGTVFWCFLRNQLRKQEMNTRNSPRHLQNAQVWLNQRTRARPIWCKGHQPCFGVHLWDRMQMYLTEEKSTFGLLGTSILLGAVTLKLDVVLLKSNRRSITSLIGGKKKEQSLPRPCLWSPWQGFPGPGFPVWYLSSERQMPGRFAWRLQL